jgi:hypothetical protein
LRGWAKATNNRSSSSEVEDKDEDNIPIRKRAKIRMTEVVGKVPVAIHEIGRYLIE